MECETARSIGSSAHARGSDLERPWGDNPDPWYVAYLQARQETIAEANLRRQDFRTYLPLYKTFRKGASAKIESELVVVHEPMFPRYIFFQPSRPTQSLATLRSTRGVHSIISFGAQMALVSIRTLDAIWDSEQQRNSVSLHALSPYQPGCRVRLRDPSFGGLEGLVHSVAAERVNVLLEILGRQTKVRIHRNLIEPA